MGFIVIAGSLIVSYSHARAAMEGAMPLKVPVRGDLKAGRNWYEVAPLARVGA